MVTPRFWQGRRVFITGHTGFKGAWLAFLLSEMGAEVSGLALPPEAGPNLHDMLGIAQRGHFVHADINDRAALNAALARNQPEVVLHLAAQALVRASYARPAETFAVNALGSVNLLDAVRGCDGVRAVVMVTTDKVYENREWPWAYRETDELGGHDPYSASKACAEIAVNSMRRSFFGPGRHPARIASARAGNVIGGGDWAADRLIPDIIRGCAGPSGTVTLRNPHAVRPWQHVLEPLCAYLVLAEHLCEGREGCEGAWNIGPSAQDARPVIEVARRMVSALGRGRIDVASDPAAPHEAGLLTLDCARARSRLGLGTLFSLDEAIGLTADWYGAWMRREDMVAVTRAQIGRISGLQPAALA
ncbi:CDP-glucose 4,6-dehydratase [Aestuariivirga litoralis]|uniref:CDP-glucose 4,6-dehydratase n=1 Tax=Aestuariivirga litoralis TaxID=2650924 RepID=A0A2W2BFE9_9HYPH|nr:CDP-glucose 4,6-dehydratase [Aestuariivirga litoralis]PZF78994.1 CDP-glucose 4,6-dehydratase [Aestuariivirga litoralis]